jgi:hypothetical protein
LWNEIEIDGRFDGRKRSWGVKKIWDTREVIHITGYSLDKSKFPRVLHKNALCVRYIQGPSFITGLGHDIAA